MMADGAFFIHLRAMGDRPAPGEKAMEGRQAENRQSTALRDRFQLADVPACKFRLVFVIARAEGLCRPSSGGTCPPDP